MLDHPLYLEFMARSRQEALLAEAANDAQGRAARASQAQRAPRQGWRRALPTCLRLRRPASLPATHA